MKNALIILLLCSTASVAQFTSTASHLRPGTTLPATCQVGSGDVFFKTSATVTPYYCSAANTWSIMGAASATSPGSPVNSIQFNDAGSFGALQNSGYLTPTTFLRGADQSIGLDDFSFSGTYTGAVGQHSYNIRINSTATPNRFQWSKDGVVIGASVAITGSAQLLSDGLSVQFAATTGHTQSDSWYVLTGPLTLSSTSFNVDGTVFAPDWVSATGFLTELKYVTGGTTRMDAPNRGSAVFCDASTGTSELLLPNTAYYESYLYQSWIITLKKTDSSANPCTFTPAGSDTIDGAASYSLLNQYDSVQIATKAGGWSVFAFTSGKGLGNLSWNPAISTASNCADSAGDAACGSATAGAFVVDAAATSTVVSTTAVTANSEIFVMFDAGLGTRLGITCNATVPTVYGVTARTAGTSFTLGATAPAVNPACFNYLIVN